MFVRRWEEGKAGEQSAGLSCPPQPRGGYGKGDQTLEGAAQGGAGGVPMPGERQDCGARCRGVVDKVGVGNRLDSMISEVLSSRIDSEIRWGKALGFLTVSVYFR